MSSIHRQKGKPHWFCAFYDATGKRCFRSTKTTNRKQAERICAAMEKTAREARLGRLTADRARAIVEEAVGEIADSVGVEMPRQSIADYLNGWLAAKGGSEGTLERYRSIVAAFITHLGPKAKQSLLTLSDMDFQTFRDKVSRKVSPGTVNTYLTVLRIAFNAAVKKNLLTRNPAIGVDFLDDSNGHKRRPFKMDELRKVLRDAGDDWKTMIHLGLYTGLRLSDCASLTAANLDLVNGQFTLTEKKTGKTRTLEIANPLLNYLEGLDLGDDPAAPLCPALYGKRETQLSNAFYDLLSDVGLVPKRDHKKKEEGQGRGARRVQSPLTFHSLRHTATSLLKRAGVSDALARDIIGHDSEAVSRIYTHFDSDSKRKALDKLPNL